jgi:hypothetical protein
MSTPLQPSPALDEPKLNSPLLEPDDDEYFQEGTQWIREDLIPPVQNMADYPVDSDVEEISMKDSTGTTVAVVVVSKMRRLAVEKTRAAFTSLAVCGTHDVHNDNVDECIPILDRKGRITGMGYTARMRIIPQNGQGVQQRCVWENFMDRLDSDKEHYPIFDERHI